jgi:4-amino-4-deoxy-L-arabinose transferase-like glycosyltransferase
MKIILKTIKNPLFWIFILALILRTYKLGEFPYGFHVDEAKVAWNTASILQTGRDDKNEVLTLYYDSFGDYRPSGIFYFTVPSIVIFGNNEFAVRFPVALIGALTVVPIYLLIELLNKKDKSIKIKTGYLAGFLLAISPWHIEVSRATNEVIISTFFALFALFFFVSLIKSKKIFHGFLAIIFLLVSYLFYHSIRFLGPLIFTTVFSFYFKEIKTRSVKIIGVLCVVFSIILTLLFSLSQNSLARLDQTSIIKNIDTIYQIERIKSENTNKNLLTTIFDNKIVIYSKTFISEYGKYFSEEFLTGIAGRPYRFATPGAGLITYVELLLILIGIIQVLRGNKSMLPILFLILAPLPAALTSEDSPNLSRAFFMLPFFTCLAAYGFETIFLLKSTFKKQIVIGVFCLLVLNFSYFIYMYVSHSINHMPYIKNYAGDSPTYRNVGTKELVLKLDSLKTKYDKIIITSFPDTPYTWYAFFTNKNASDINQTYSESTKERVYGNIIFSQDKCPSDYATMEYRKQNILIIDSWECPYKSRIADGQALKMVGSIKRPDGSEVFAFLERDWNRPLLINGVYY